MAYTTTIYDPKEGLERINEDIKKFDEKRFLVALNYKNWNETEIELMSKEISEYLIKLEKEHIRLIEFAKNFNKEFVTDNNRCFSTALKLLRKLRSGVSEVKRIYKKFCPRPPRCRFYYKATTDKKRSAFDYSYLSINSYQLTLFPLDSEIYPLCVRGLYHEIGKFFHQLSLSLGLCLKVLADEEEIRKDSDYCNYLFEKLKKEVMKEMIGIISLMPSDADFFQEEHNPAIASLKKFSSIEAWVSHGFHNFQKNDVKYLILKEAREEEKRGDITQEEMVIFGNFPDRIRMIRNIINHFDDLLPEDYHRRKLDAKTIAMFMQWCGANNETLFVNYFNKLYENNPNHSHKIIQKNAVNTAKNNLIADKEQYNDFVQRLQNLHFIPSTAEKIVC